MTGRQWTRPAGELPLTVPTQTRGSLRVVIECAGTCIMFETFVCSLEALFEDGVFSWATCTHRRPPAVSTGARRRRNGVSDSRTLTEYSSDLPALGVGTARLRGRTHRVLRARVVLDR